MYVDILHRASLVYASATLVLGQVFSTTLGVVTDNVVIAEYVGTRADLRRNGGAVAMMRAL